MPKNFDIGRWVGIALYLLFAWQIASVLTSPEPEDGPIILNFVTLIEFEFILIAKMAEPHNFCSIYRCFCLGDE